MVHRIDALLRRIWIFTLDLEEERIMLIVDYVFINNVSDSIMSCATNSMYLCKKLNS
jgi:hypothetical protein